LKNSRYAIFEESHTTQDVQATPHYHFVFSSQGSQGLRRGVAVLNLTIDSSRNPKSSSSPNFAFIKKKASDQDIEETNIESSPSSTRMKLNR
jgi:hypothetical protein